MVRKAKDKHSAIEAPSTEIEPLYFGVSFSIKQCRNLSIHPETSLTWLLEKGWRRFRLMSYWSLHEPEQGLYDFSELDTQIQLIASSRGVISLCLGVKQPRWPEYHWPSWALKLSEQERTEALLTYITTVVNRYKSEPVIISYQLENEALLQGFGENIIIDRARLRAEYNLLESLDPFRPIYMSTSNGWGIPLRRPIPEGGIGFSLYTIQHIKGKYSETIQKPWLHKVRSILTRAIYSREAFIHELQLEPWGPYPIWNMSIQDQAKSMDIPRIRKNIRWAKQINCYPVDIWGAEWWYWRMKNGDDSIYAAVESEIKSELST